MSDRVERLNAALEGRYFIERELGEGGMATVYLAYDERHDRKVAIKVLRPELAASVGDERFLREIRTTANLRHPHIVPLYDSGEADGFLFYVMPLIEGESLRDRLERDGRLAVDEALQLSKEIAGALSYAHRRGVVHRDIKPENIMLEAGHAVVTDFGIANAITPVDGARLTQTGMFFGTPAYMSPEQASGEGEPDARSDLYSLACVTYEMLAGEPPFSGPTSAVVLARHMLDPVPPLTTARPGLGAHIALTVERAMAKAAVDRFSDVAAWVEALTTDTPSAPTGSPAAPAPPADSRGIESHELPVAPDVLERSIVVLPFANMSSEPENEYFSDGLSEDLIVKLSRGTPLRVISRASAWQYKEKGAGARQISRALGVAYILSGSVRRSGSHVRVSAELVDARNDDHLWAETYDREMEDLFEIQSDVATSIAAAITPNLTRPAAVGPSASGGFPTRDLAAYDSYLLGRHHWNRRTTRDVALSIEKLQQAVDRDPAFWLAHAALADSRITLALYGDRAPHDVMPLAGESAERALSLRADSAEALTARACVSALYEWDWVASEDGFREAIAADGKYETARVWFAMHHLVPLRRFEEAGEHLAVAIEQDPLSPSVAISRGALFLYEGKLDAAAEAFEAVLGAHPDSALAHFLLGLSRLWAGSAEEAVQALRTARAVSGGSVETTAGLGQALAASGRMDEARRLFDELVARSERSYVSATRLAELQIAMGDPGRGVELLQRAVDEKASDLVWIDVLRAFDPVRDEPGFRRLRTTIIP